MLYILASLYCVFLVIANITANKIVDILGLKLPAGFLLYALTFLITDVISEVYGKEIAKKIVFLGLTTYPILYVYSYFVISLPGINELAKHVDVVLSTTPCILIASITAFILSQVHDVYTFHKLKKLTNGKHLWLRNNVSTIISQLIDTITFITLGLYALPIVMINRPIIDLSTLPFIIASQYIWKVIVALLDTPFCYLFVNVLKSRFHSSNQIY